jgi:histidinol-phosphate aminotransferase
VTRDELAAALRAHGLEPAAPAAGNFLYVDVGDGAAMFERLLREGVIVRPLQGFGAPEAIRITVGTPEDHAFLAEALGRVKTALPAS